MKTQTQYNNTIETRYALGKGEYLTSEYYRQLLNAGYYTTQSNLYYYLYAPTGERVFKQLQCKDGYKLFLLNLPKNLLTNNIKNTNVC